MPAPFTLGGRYRLIEVLGEGGMGRVWAAHDLLLDRDVAVKEMRPPTGLTATEREELRVRVIREARATARVDHPHVVRVIDVLHEHGEPWIVMELVTSRSLLEVIEEDGPLAPERAARIGLAVLDALRSAHASGLLHRDVKPANVLLGVDGRVVLTDFGLASVAGDSSMTATGVVLGSPSYLAPERVLEQPSGPAADLWSLGATLYTAVEGRPPYSKSSPMATLAAVAAGEPLPPPRQAGSLAPALEALLRRDPDRRADAATAERLLRAAASGRTVDPEPAARPSANRPVPGHRRRGGGRPKPVLVGLAAITVLVAATGLVLRGRADPVANASPRPNPPSGRPASRALYHSGGVYQLVNPWARDSVIDLPGTDTNTVSGTRVQLFQNLRDHDNSKDQYWKIVDAPGGTGQVNIINEFSRLSLAVEGASTENMAKLVQATTDPADPSQQWSLRDAGNDAVHIVNSNSGKVVELLGDDLGPPNADGTWNAYRVEQFSLQPAARDQVWVLSPR